MQRAALSVLTKVQRLGVWLLVPVIAALMLYQPQGVETGAGLSLHAPSVAIIATSPKVLAAKSSVPEARGRPLLAILVGGVEAPAIPFRASLLQPCDAETPLVQRPRISWQARAPPAALAPTMT